MSKRVQRKNTTGKTSGKKTSTNKKLTTNQIEYQKQAKRINNAIKNNEKRGYLIDYQVPEMPKRVTKQMLADLASITPYKLRIKGEYINRDTGEILKGVEGVHIEKEQKRKKDFSTELAEAIKKNRVDNNKRYKEQAKKKHKQKIGDKYDKNIQHEASGGNTIYNNVVDDLIAKLSTPINYKPDGYYASKKYERALQTAETERLTLYQLILHKAEEEGKDALGWRLQAEANHVKQLIDTSIYKASNSDEITTASREIQEIINGAPLSPEQARDLSMESEANESFESPE